jgi:glycosyltransferase involved in cell wall biosynthesis
MLNRQTTLDLNGPILSIATNPLSVSVGCTNSGIATFVGLATASFPTQTPSNSATPTGSVSYQWYLESYGYKNSKIIINSPELMSINSAAISAKNFNLRDIFSLKSEILIYIYNGYLTHGRGIEIMLEAFSKTETSSVLVFLGEGPLIEKIESYKEQNDNIFVHQMVRHDEVTQIVSSADYGLCLIEDASLSDRYSLPNKLFEYIFAGLPVVASNLPEIKKLVLDSNLGVVINLSVENLIEVLSKNSLLTEVSKLTDKNSISHLSWESQAVKLGEIYSLMSDSYEV